MLLTGESSLSQGETPRNEVAAASMMEQNLLDESHLHVHRVVLLRGNTIPCEASFLRSLDLFFWSLLVVVCSTCVPRMPLSQRAPSDLACVSAASSNQMRASLTLVILGCALVVGSLCSPVCSYGQGKERRCYQGVCCFRTHWQGSTNSTAHRLAAI